MLGHNTLKELKKACGGPGNKPDNTGNPKKSKVLIKSESYEKEREFIIEVIEKSPKFVTPINLSPLSADPIADDINVENKELYQINNFLR